MTDTERPSEYHPIEIGGLGKVLLEQKRPPLDNYERVVRGLVDQEEMSKDLEGEENIYGFEDLSLELMSDYLLELDEKEEMKVEQFLMSSDVGRGSISFNYEPLVENDESTETYGGSQSAASI